MQGVLDPSASAAASIHTLTIVLVLGGAVVFALTMTLVWQAVRSKPQSTRSKTWILTGGVLFPIVVLTALLWYSSRMSYDLSTLPSDNALHIDIIGHRWWWEVQYRGTTTVVTANEIHVPVGRPVQVHLTSADVIHSFWVPNVAGKVDMVPGHINRLQFTVDRPGNFAGQCAEYCGGQHALMKLVVVGQDPRVFDDWLSEQAEEASHPMDALLQEGQGNVSRAGCGACHTIRGTDLVGRVGPDLTHIGSRQTLGAGTLNNHVGTLAAWVADSQGLKPGNRMPSFSTFDGPALRSVAAYLNSLE